MRRVGGWPLVLAALACLTSQTLAAQQQRALEPARDKSLLLESRAGVRRALKYLEGAQRPDGSWQGHPAITALVVTAMISSAQEEFGPESKPVRRGLECIRGFCKPDGGIYDKFYPSYSTSFCLIALVEAGRAQDEERVRRARRFLLELQADEQEGFSRDDPQYGGWGYEKHASGQGMHTADMSNTQFALEALKVVEEAEQKRAEESEEARAPERAKTKQACEKAMRYLRRCQNHDGGFIYRPDESKAGRTAQGSLRSYGSASCAGLKCMIQTGTDRDDPRVRAAFDWIRNHWSVRESPGLGQQGLYYYYQTMARALDLYGEEIIVDAQGECHEWRAELVDQLLKVQRADGSWVNENGRWMENIPDLATAYSVLALGHATRSWQAAF